MPAGGAHCGRGLGRCSSCWPARHREVISGDSEHHSDGEHMPLEALAQLNRTCPHARCEGLMLPDADDPGHSKCSECSRSTFAPPQAIVEEKPQTMKMEHVIFRGLFSDGYMGQGQAKHDRGIPQAHLHPAVRKFR